MEGVTVTPAVLAEPPVGQRIKDGEQPVKLVIINPTSNIDRPLTMTVQVAADTSFTGPSYSQTGVTPSSSGVTRLTLPGKLPGGRTYYWRVKADDGANTSGWSTQGRDDSPTSTPAPAKTAKSSPTKAGSWSSTAVQAATPASRSRDGRTTLAKPFNSVSGCSSRVRQTRQGSW